MKTNHKCQISLVLSVFVLMLMLSSCGSRGNNQRQRKTYLDRPVSSFVQNSSGISQKIVLNKNNMTYQVYDKFVVTGSSEWSLSAEGSYTEDVQIDNSVVKIEFRQNGGFQHLGDYRSAKVFLNNDTLEAYAPSNTFDGHYVE